MTLIEQIKSFFPNINQSPRLLDALLAVVQKTNITKGTVLLKEGDYIQFIPLVLQGLIKVYKEVEQGNELLLYYIAPGETCIMS
ncbi:MAG: cyclic nucleotide-binding domain-containing protein, partial [Flavobacteriaceae bacterium]|nr:cyclic nucleotide-binding domain-containing protein [Flavobacteriaceae bacterium]